jgi:BT1 family
MSDVFPIYGMRRKPYLTIGALVYSSAFMLYALAAIDNVVRLGVILFTRNYTVLRMATASSRSRRKSKIELLM